MKTVLIRNIYVGPKKTVFKQPKYTIMLDFGRSHHFSDLKEARKFLVEVSRFMTLKLYDLNFILIDIYSLYRTTWAYLDNYPKPTPQKLYNSERTIKTLFGNIDNCIEKLTSKNNQNATVLNLFKLLISAMLEILKEINTINSKRNPLENYRVKILINRIEKIDQEIKSY